MLYVFYWVIPRRLNFICRRFETLCLFHLHRQAGKEYTILYMSLRMRHIVSSDEKWHNSKYTQLDL